MSRGRSLRSMHFIWFNMAHGRKFKQMRLCADFNPNFEKWGRKAGVETETICKLQIKEVGFLYTVRDKLIRGFPRGLRPRSLGKGNETHTFYANKNLLRRARGVRFMLVELWTHVSLGLTTSEAPRSRATTHSVEHSLASIAG